MELREYFRIISKYKTLFWATVIIVTLAAFFFTKYQPKSYLASTTLTVNKSSAIKQSQTDYYLFDNYYNIQSSGLFSQIVTSWFDSPAVVKEIYAKADLSLPNISQRALSKTFKAIRIEPATINVLVTGQDREQVGKLINAAAVVMQDKTNEFGQQDKENIYDIVKFAPIISDISSNLWLNTLIGLVVGILIGVILSLGIDYFKKTPKN